MNNSIAGIFSNDVFTDRKNYGFIKLPNPRTGTDGVYLWNKERNILNEIQNFARQHKTWVINENVVSNPGCYISNLIDPLFLAIPFLLNHAHHFSTIDIIMRTDDYPQFWIIMSSIFESNLKLGALAECKKIDDETYVYQYSEEKTMNWLSGKVEKLSAYLAEKKIVADDSRLAVSIHFKDCTETDEQYAARVTKEAKSTAIDIVCDYISPEFEKLFKKHLNFEDIPLENRPIIASPRSVKKKPTQATEELDQESPVRKIAKTVNKKLKSRSQSCLQPIDNFFKRKD